MIEEDNPLHEMLNENTTLVKLILLIESLLQFVEVVRLHF